MSFKYFDRVLESSTTTGTGALTLGGPGVGYRSFASVYSNGDTFNYTIVDQSGPNWEVGTGSYSTSGNLLNRSAVFASSNSGSLVNFTSGALFTWVDLPAAGIVPAVTSGGSIIISTPGSGNFVVQTGDFSTTLVTFSNGGDAALNVTNAKFSAGAFLVNGSTIPVNGIYLSSANTVGISANTTDIVNVNSIGLGVGVSSPLYPLHVVSNTGSSSSSVGTVYGSFISSSISNTGGGDAQYGQYTNVSVDANVGFGNACNAYGDYINFAVTNSGMYSDVYGSFINYTGNSDGSVYGNYVNLNGSVNGASYGQYSIITASGESNTLNNYGELVIPTNNTSVSNATGFQHVLTMETNGELNNYTAFWAGNFPSTLADGANLSNYVGFSAQSPTLTGSAVIGQSFGSFMGNMGASGTTTSYGIFIDRQSDSTTNWSIYCADGFFVLNTGDTSVGVNALSTNATSSFFWLPSCPGTPTGTPANIPYSGAIALVYDTSDNLLYANNAGSWSSIGGSSGGLAWTEITTTSISAAINNGYVLNNASLVTLTLPAIAALGSIVRIAGKGAGGWTIAQNSGQTVFLGNKSSTTGASGHLDSTNRRDSIELVCVTANNDWDVISSFGNISIT